MKCKVFLCYSIKCNLFEKKVKLIKIGKLYNKYFLKFSLHDHGGPCQA